MARQRPNKPSKASRLTFRSTDALGSTSAENDELLHNCFVDSGYIAQLANTTASTPCIVVGRTGSGKSALLLEFERRKSAIRLKPESLALNHISRSNIIGALAELGVKLDPFYKLLWRQFFCVHALAARFQSMSSLDRWFAQLQPRYRRARAVLEEWAGKDFFKNNATISTQLVQTLEKKISGGLELKGFNLEASKAKGFERREDIAPICQDVITRDLAEQLQAIMNVTTRVFEEIENPVYFVIDALDEDWVQEDQRYVLIMGLIQTLSDMRGVPNSKIVAAIRRDLLEEVYERARPAGFQEEKLQDMYLTVQWTRDDLTSLLDSRVNAILRDRYAKSVKLTHRDVFPDVVPLDGGKPRTIDYLLSRTQLRPRDLITFANQIIRQSKAANVTVARIREAEKKYSEDRLKSVADEWHVQEPHLDQLARVILRDQPSRLTVAELDEKRIREKALSRAVVSQSINPRIVQLANGEISWTAFATSGVQVLYRFGIIRLKPRPDEKFRSGLDEDAPDDIEDVDDSTRIEIHPMFWQALNIRVVP